MTVFLGAFLATTALLWLTSVGYLGVLALLAARRRRVPPAVHDLPRVAVVMATYNEEARIAAKLADFARTDYPPDRLRLVIVDGRSTDGTTALIDAAPRTGFAVELLRAPDATCKLDQLRYGIASVDEAIVVGTDADSQLDPSCVRALVSVLVADPSTGVVGARIRPDSTLLEERIYWWFLNTLWWLEGEALGAAAVSGVCYALRRGVVEATPRAGGADDILFALAAGAQGLHVRLCREAWAIETRVPQTAREFIRFRQRRGAGYLGALLAPLPAGGQAGSQVARLVRLFHFLVSPLLAGAMVLIGFGLCWTAYWPWPLAGAALFVAPMLAALFGSTTLDGLTPRRWRLGLAAVRLIGFVWLSLLVTPRPPAQGPESVRDPALEQQPEQVPSPEGRGSA